MEPCSATSSATAMLSILAVAADPNTKFYNRKSCCTSDFRAILLWKLSENLEKIILTTLVCVPHAVARGSVVVVGPLALGLVVIGSISAGGIASRGGVACCKAMALN